MGEAKVTFGIDSKGLQNSTLFKSFNSQEYICRLLYSSDHSDVKLHIGKQMIPFPGHSLARIPNTLPQSLPTQFSTERDMAFAAQKDTWIVSMMLEYIYTGNYSRVLSHSTISNIMPTTGHCLRVSH